MELEKLKKVAFDRWIIIEKSRGKRVLEIGCVNHSIPGVLEQRKSETWLFDYLQEYAEKATGIDIDKEGVEYLKKEGLDIREGDAQNFDLNEQFDVIIASRIIDHLLNLDGFFLSCQRNLKGGGILIVSDDNILCLPKLIYHYLKRNLEKFDKDITLKPIPCLFENFVGRYGFNVEEIIYNFGTGNNFNLKFLKFIERITPRKLIFQPLFYPAYIAILKRKH